MADITMCTNPICSKRDKCYRAMATPDEHNQSYNYFVPVQDCYIYYDKDGGDNE